MTDYRVLVTGSRDWDDELAVNVALLDAAVKCSKIGRHRLVVVHGGARGADSFAAAFAGWAQGRSPVIEIVGEAHAVTSANWREFGRAAGMRRNAEMVSLGADVCLAFILPCTDLKCRRPGAHGSHGASHCAQIAEANGIETRRIAPE
jgi:hypothetical protein